LPVPAADPTAPFQRVVIHGVTGSGKSTTAARIADATCLPWTSVDDLTWQPGWVSTDEDEQRRLVTEICAGERWVLDTAYSIWREIPMARTDLVVALDYPRWGSLQRLLRRTAHRLVTREPICNGNVETVRSTLSSDSIIAWHLRSFASKRDWVQAALAAPTGPPVLRFTSPPELGNWISRLRPPSG
jgi:adenylate kinase family enzyme